MAKQSKGQQETVERVMHEFKHGELESSRGGKVKSRKQAVAIALSEAGASKYDSEKEKKHNLARTKSKERKGETAMQEKEGKGAMRKLESHYESGGKSGGRKTSRAGGKTKSELYAEAKRRQVEGRSKMSKDELARALHA